MAFKKFKAAYLRWCAIFINLLLLYNKDKIMFNTYVPTNSCRFVNYFQKEDYPDALFWKLETSYK